MDEDASPETFVWHQILVTPSVWHLRVNTDCTSTTQHTGQPVRNRNKRYDIKGLHTVVPNTWKPASETGATCY